jgi:SAM-dependent methyltransferase
MSATPAYLLGNDAGELQRLEEQARILAPATRAILQMAGIEPGMRVIDLGTGAGDVALELAAMVGPSGSVTGIDQSAEALAWARRRTLARGLGNVSFVQDDLHTAAIGGRVDAVVGRLVLLYIADPAVVLRRYAGMVRQGGLVVSMEYEMTSAGSLPRLPLTDLVVGWIAEAFRRSGHDPLLGARLRGVMADAGLDDATVLGLQTYVPHTDPSGARMAAGVVRTLLPAIERAGIASAADIDIGTLEQRIGEALIRNGAIFKPPALAGAWARVGKSSNGK